MASRVVVALTKCPSLQNLGLRGGTLPVACMGPATAAALAKCTGLTSLDLSSNGFDATVALQLAPCIKHLTNLRLLDVHGNRVGYEAATVMVDAVSRVSAKQPHHRVVLMMWWDGMLATQLSDSISMFVAKNMQVMLSNEQIRQQSSRQ